MHNICLQSGHMARIIYMIQYAQYMFVVWPHGQDNLHDSICTIYVCCLTTWPEYFTWANMHNTYLQSDYMVRRVCIISFSSPSVQFTMDVHKDGNIFPRCFHTQGTSVGYQGLQKTYTQLVNLASVQMPISCYSSCLETT